ncbi:MAG: hypothetical protein NBKEAIPA_03425 [Nitrospirae bacterium]|nr:MAG: hypothetical protein UZ03_NOB001003575 [Nitrospira sp. OLB3]MBV6471493.1 hypothetical protein [Nitrospirota bacterium]
MTFKSRIGGEEYKGVFVLGCFRPSSWSEGRFHSESCRHSPNPGFVAERATSLHTHSERLQFRHSLWPIHARQPIAWTLPQASR